MIKALFVITSPDAGGTETYLLRFLEYLDKNTIKESVESVVLCKKSKDGELANRYGQISHLECVGHLGYLSPIPYMKLFHYLSREKFDVVCDMTGNFAALVLASAKLAGIPKRISFFRESRNQFKPSLFRNIYAKMATWLTHGLATKILSNSYDALNYFYPHWREEPDKEYSIVYNGIDRTNISNKSQAQMRQLLGLPQDAFVICHTGRYVEAKNHSMIIDCAADLCRSHPDIYFVLIGKGVKENLQRRVSESGLEDRILLLGYRDDVLDVIKCADLFYFPSLNEGQPNALIEALVSDLPFVASDIPSIKDIVPKQFRADLISPKSKEQNIAALESKYIRRNSLNEYTCGEYARLRFSADELFGKFLNQLI